jgi:uncharacterized membrane protein YphA (DoxX/SURF4 family)
MKNISSLVLRVGLGLVMLWFGVSQGKNPSAWVNYLPTWTESLSLSQITFIYLNSWFEICLGVLLILGFQTRIVATLLALHLIGIVLSVGYNATGIRDFGLTMALVSIALASPEGPSLDRFFDRPTM